MKARDVVGRKIVAIRQQRYKPRRYDKRVATVLDALVLDDGTVITFQACEGDSEPFVEGHVWKKASR